MYDTHNGIRIGGRFNVAYAVLADVKFNFLERWKNIKKQLNALNVAEDK